MGLYILKRLGLAVPTLIGSTIIVFLLIHLAPGEARSWKVRIMVRQM